MPAPASAAPKSGRQVPASGPGNPGDRPNNVINSLFLDPEALERHNIKLKAKFDQINDLFFHYDGLLAGFVAGRWDSGTLIVSDATGTVGTLAGDFGPDTHVASSDGKLKFLVKGGDYTGRTFGALQEIIPKRRLILFLVRGVPNNRGSPR